MGRQISRAASALTSVTGGLASQLPGISFFTNQTPPSFAPILLITSGLTIAIFAWVFSTPSNVTKRIRIGLVSIITAIVLAIFYTALLQWVTVIPPPQAGSHERFQIGFGLSPFSLTPTGITEVHTHPDTTPTDIMLRRGLFQPGGPELIWQPWTITTSWFLLSILFFSTYFSWTLGLACIAAWISKRG